MRENDLIPTYYNKSRFLSCQSLFNKSYKLFFNKCSGKDVYNVEKSKVLIWETMLRLDLIAFITSGELSIHQNKLTPEFS